MNQFTPHLHKDQVDPQFFEPYVEKKNVPVFTSKRIRAMVPSGIDIINKKTQLW